jgi:replicative DNA helicase
MAKYDFLNDWKEDKQYDVYLALRDKLKTKIIQESQIADVSSTALTDSYDTYLEKLKGESFGLKTQYTALDNALQGLQKGSLYVVGGYTGVGKTLFVCNIALNIVMNEAAHVLFLTTEMPHHQVTGRIRQLFRSLAPDDLDDKELMMGNEDIFRQLYIEYVDNNYDISVGLIEGLLQKNKEQVEAGLADKTQLLIIDNLQWFSRGGANMAESTGLATQAIKKLAIQYEIPIILVSHLNRLAVKQIDPDLDTLKNSSYIEQDADAVIMLSRDTEQYSKDTIQVSIKKNRLTGEFMDNPLLLTSDGNKYLKKLEYYKPDEG